MFRIPELRKRVVYTLALLAVYRVGIFVSAPGVDRSVMQEYLQATSSAGGFLGLFNFFSGGALEQMSVFAFGIMPYVTASIIMQLVTVVIPALERLQKEGEQTKLLGELLVDREFCTEEQVLECLAVEFQLPFVRLDARYFDPKVVELKPYDAIPHLLRPVITQPDVACRLSNGPP